MSQYIDLLTPVNEQSVSNVSKSVSNVSKLEHFQRQLNFINPAYILYTTWYPYICYTVSAVL